MEETTDESTISAIHRVMGEITETKQSVKKFRLDSADVLEQNDEYRALRDELKELTAKRAKLKDIMAGDKDYMTLAGELEEFKFKLKDLQEILSHHLVAYYNETQDTQIKDPSGEVHQVVISAKIMR